MDMRTNERDITPPFHRLLYRYFWPFQYFRDVTQGGVLERQQNYRHNRRMRHYLPGFMAKWAILTGLCLYAGNTMHAWGAVPLATACFILGIWTLIVLILLGIDWLWLERFPELY